MDLASLTELIYWRLMPFFWQDYALYLIVAAYLAWGNWAAE